MYQVFILVVQLLSHVPFFGTPQTAACQASLSFSIPQNLLKSYPLSQWCHPTISSSVVPFSSCLQSFSASGSFPMSLLFASGSQSIGASASILPVNIQDGFPSGLTGLISLLSKKQSFPAPQFKSTISSVLSLLYGLHYRILMNSTIINKPS